MPTEQIVIIGGGVVGSSIAYHLCRSRFRGRVIVVERDPTYRRASSFLAMGGIRQQFSSAANVAMARYSVRFYTQLDETLAAHGHQTPVNFRQRGYLFLVNDAMAEAFERRYATQRRLGASIERLSRDAIKAHVPDLVLDDIVFGLFGPHDGYGEPRAVLAGLRRLAEAAGATYVTASVSSIALQDGASPRVTIDDGVTYETRAVVCAAGAFSATVAAAAGLTLPVTPVRQQLFRCDLPWHWPHRFPVVVDPTGVHWRHDDAPDSMTPDRIVVACTKLDEPPGENFTCDMTRWDTDFRPPLVSRLPAFEGVQLVEGWAGLYEMTPDHNPLLGEHPAGSGFFVAAGFSGHGLMMAPATGAAMAELVAEGAATSVDIGPFDPTRFDRDAPFWDDAMI